MNSKTAVIAVVAIAVIAGIYFASQSSAPGGARNLSRVEGGAVTGALLPDEAPQVEEDSLLHDISADSLAIVHFTAQNIDPAVKYFERLWGRVAATKLGQKQGMRASLLETIKQQQPASADTQELEKAAEIVSQAWDDVDEAIIVVSDKKVSAPELGDVPLTLFEAEFSGGGTVDRLKAFIDDEVLKGQPVLEENDITLKRRDGAEGVYDFTLNSPAGKGVSGAVVAQGDSFSVTFGTQDLGVFRASEAGKMLVNSAAWRTAGLSMLPGSGMFIYLDYSRLQTLMDDLMKLAAEAGGQEAAVAGGLQGQLQSQFGQFGVLGSSVVFGNGVTSLTCITIKEGSKMEQFYSRLLDARGKAESAGEFYKLISDNTLLAFRVQLDVIPFYFDMFREYYGTALDEAQAPEDAQRLRAMIDKAEQQFNRLGFREFGVVLNIAPGNPMPELGMLLGQGALEGEQALSTVAEVMNDYFPQPVASVDSASGSPRLKINTGQPVPVEGAVVGSNSVYITSNPYSFEKVSQALSGEGNYLLKENTGLEHPEAALRTGDYFFYLNSELALQMARPWLGMAAAQAPGSGPEELQEVADVFAGRFISTQFTTRGTEGAVCSRAQMVTLQ